MSLEGVLEQPTIYKCNLSKEEILGKINTCKERDFKEFESLNEDKEFVDFMGTIEEYKYNIDQIVLE